MQLQMLPDLAHLLLELVDLGKEVGFVELSDHLLQRFHANATTGFLDDFLRVVLDCTDLTFSFVAVNLLVAHIVEQILDPFLRR